MGKVPGLDVARQGVWEREPKLMKPLTYVLNKVITPAPIPLFWHLNIEQF